jgi:hypothetical protein
VGAGFTGKSPIVLSFLLTLTTALAFSVKWNGILTMQMSLAAFYNTSDLGVRFEPIGNTARLELKRAAERIYGLEGTVDWQPAQAWSIGGTATYIQGEYEDDNPYIAPDSSRVPPLKLTAYVQEVCQVSMLSKNEEVVSIYGNPYSGEINGARLCKETFTGFLFTLHAELAGGEFGHLVVSVCGLVMLGITFTGLVLWTGWRNLARGFSINLKAHWQRTVFD